MRSGHVSSAGTAYETNVVGSCIFLARLAASGLCGNALVASAWVFHGSFQSTGSRSIGAGSSAASRACLAAAGSPSAACARLATIANHSAARSRLVTAISHGNQSPPCQERVNVDQCVELRHLDLYWPRCSCPETDLCKERIPSRTGACLEAFGAGLEEAGASCVNFPPFFFGLRRLRAPRLVLLLVLPHSLFRIFRCTRPLCSPWTWF